MTSAKVGAIAPVIKRNGAELRTDLLEKIVHLRVERAIGLIGRATLRFIDNGYTLSAGDTFALGTQISIAEPTADMLLDGTVTGINLDQSSQGVPELVIVVDDAGYRLTRGTHVATYLQGTYTDVLQKIASRNGLRPRVDSSTLTMEYVLQAGTDIAFLNTATERLGLQWYIDDGPTLVVEKAKVASPVATLRLGENLQEISVRASGLRPTGVSVHGWNSDTQGEVTSQNPASSAGEMPALVQPYSGTGPKKLSDAATAVADIRPLTSNEAQAMAGALYDEWSAAAVVARGTAEINSAIKPGVTVRVSDAGPASGSYLITSAEHVYDSSGFTTRFVSGPRRPSGLVDTLGPAEADPGFTVAGLIIGIVTNSDDPDTSGRVKVRYTGVDGQIESPWARVVAIGGGPSRGAIFSPEVNDEVLVGFEHGDTRRPVVIGGLHSKRNALPTGAKYVENGQVNYRRITSRKNHMIEMADGAGPEEQHLLLQVGTAAHKLRLGADRFDVEVAQGKGVTIKAGDAKFDISTSGDITIEGNNITLKAKGNVDVEGVKVTVKGSGQAVVQGTQVQVKADGMASVEASGPLTLKGAIVGIN